MVVILLPQRYQHLFHVCFWLVSGGCTSVCLDSVALSNIPDYCIDEPEITQERVELVRASWKAIIEGETTPYRLKKFKDPSLTPIVFFYDTFYNRLFESAPMIQPLFKNDMRVQGRALTHMIETAVGFLDAGPSLATTLSKLALRHNRYGVTRAHFHVAGHVLLHTLQVCLADLFFDEVRTAWLHVYSLMMIMMIPRIHADPLDNIPQRRDNYMMNESSTSKANSMILSSSSRDHTNVDSQPDSATPRSRLSITTIRVMPCESE
eukprot:TRINITY_DN2336_c0_g2_i7.p1 TRINITY_DN2336_c0_g2~~TRINITY_DN2336_c0_g2_i7.p1  ORF type:complete len:264 (-),score=14.45 TRINITY_DN2336_c0_g2_i7:416-1207(-)